MSEAINNEINQLHLEAVADEQAAADFKASLEGGDNTEPTDQAVERVPDMEMVGHLNTVFTMATAGLAPNWNVQQEEIEILSVATEAVLDKYMPGAKESIGPEFMLLLAVGGIVLPRMNVPRHLPPPDEQASQEAEQIKTDSPAKVDSNQFGDLAAFEEAKGVINAG